MVKQYHLNLDDKDAVLKDMNGNDATNKDNSYLLELIGLVIQR